MRFTLISMAIAVISTLWLMTAIAYSGEPFEENLVVYWPLNGDVKDKTGHGVDGEIKGDPKWVEGKSGKALEFDGVDDFVFVRDNPVLDLTDELTLMAWVNAYNIPASGERKLVYKGDAYLIKVRASKLSGDVHVNGWIGSLYDSKPTPLREWHHVAITYDGKAEHLYVDGVETDSKPRAGKISVTNKHLSIGAIKKTDTSNPYDFFNGIIDEIRIYNRALTADEIQLVMKLPTSVEPVGKLASIWGELKK